MTATETVVLTVVYDLRDPGAWEQANRARSTWGKLYTDVHHLEDDHVVLVFRPADDERWGAWEKVRLGWILDHHRGALAA
jgi:hypothetical protein